MLRPLQSTRRSSGPVRGSANSWAGQTVRRGGDLARYSILYHI